MEQGARFLKCDLHMHTPADPAGWNGPPMGESGLEQREAAERYVEQCYTQGLELVAITDHNFASKSFIPLLRDAATRLAVKYGYSLIIMSGFEIQADVGKGVHILALFDPTLTEETVDHVLTQCGVPVDRFDKRVPSCSHKRLSDILESVQIPGRNGVQGVVILPHCQSDKGVFDNDRLADWLQQDEYKNPDLFCVEVNKPLSQMPPTWQNLFECEERCEPQWRRSRSLACIMSSDAKDYGDKDRAHNIGSRYTWIKLSRVTAEGLRQAFLAHKSRIRLETPTLPKVHIERMCVSACKFFSCSPFEVSFNRQFNALIGGRGTGKSTILEYLRWALHDQPPEVAETDVEIPQFARNRDKIIRETLQEYSKGAWVAVEFRVNETLHVITRYVEQAHTTLKIGDEDAKETSADELRHIIPLQAYSQKQLSTISVRVEELRRLLESPLQDKLRGVSERIEDLKARIQRFYRTQRDFKALDGRIRISEAERTSKKAQIESLKTQLTDLLPEDQRTLDMHQAHLGEQQAVTRMNEDGDSIAKLLQETIDRLSSIPRSNILGEDSPQGAKIGDMHAQIIRARERVRSRIQQAQSDLAAEMNAFSAQVDEWNIGFNEHITRFVQARERTQVHHQQLCEIERLSNEVLLLDQRIRETVSSKEALEYDPAEEEDNARRWTDLHRERGDLLAEACARLTEQSNGDICAILKRGGDVRRAFDLLRGRLGGSHTRTDWLENLIQRVSEGDDPAEEWTRVVNDFRRLAEVPPELSQSVSVELCPALTEAGFGQAALQRIASQLDMAAWVELRLVSLEDKPEFFYRVEESLKIPFESASPGQQATALLTVLLKQEGGPLLIDQPEDDLDNAIISGIVKTIWSAKERRQLIFTSHNANLVVNGDAELVIHCDYRSAKNRSMGTIKCAGAIEDPDICTAIKSVMEGGEQSFELRKAKYGF